jgi:hypothetical protein
MHFDLARAKRCLVMSQRRSNVCPFLHSTCFFQVLSSDSAGEARQSEGVEGDDEVDTVQRFLLHISYSIRQSISKPFRGEYSSFALADPKTLSMISSPRR